MDAGHALLELLLILGAARLAGELCDRIRVPAVVGEIVAGLVIGPSLLGWVELNETIALLAEFGVILLLLQVGMEMNLSEMRTVGGPSFGVAIAGVVLPFAAGFGVGVAFGQEPVVAAFLGAALAATSVGITARAFADLGMLATTESRIVLGAAVVDDVLGLVILTVMVRVVEQGSVDLLGAAGVLGVAVVFLVVATFIAQRLAPPLFTWIRRRAMNPSTLLIAAIVVTLAFAELAVLAKLAAIIGAFVAGLALGQTRQAERIERDLTPLSAFFVPIFFVSVGLEVNVADLVDPSVLGLAGALLAVAIVGKVAAGWAAGRGPVDRLLIGIGMMPRGEVGLIFATIGLTSGALTKDLYAAILVVVLVTTLIAPWAIRARLAVAPIADRPQATTEMPSGGWLRLADDMVELRARPAGPLALGVALEAARLSATHRPSDELVDWLRDAASDRLVWDDPAIEAFCELIRTGSRRSWRLLDATGVLGSALPDLEDELSRRRRDASVLDPAHLLRFPVVESFAELVERGEDAAAALEANLTNHPQVLPLAALAVDLAGDDEPAEVAARELGVDLGLPDAVTDELAAAAADADLLRGAASQLVGHDPERDPQLIERLSTIDRLRRSYVLGLALGELDQTHREALDELYARLVDRLGATR